jgi:hypothetical protein
MQFFGLCLVRTDTVAERAAQFIADARAAYVRRIMAGLKKRGNSGPWHRQDAPANATRVTSYPVR